MRVGVVMPTYNQARYLPDALAALAPGSGQAPHALVVVNDASTDDTEWVLRRGLHRVDSIMVHRENQGCGAAINTGAAFMLMDGVDAMSWVSSDNLMYPDWIATLSAALRPGVGAVYSAFDMPGQKPGKTVTVRQGPYDPARLVSSENCYFGPSFLIRSEVWRAAGPHEGGSAHDYGHWARVEEACLTMGLSIGYVDKPLCWYRVHDEQTVKRRPELYDATEQRAKTLARRAAR